jgi:hypothetical protein
MYKRNILEQFRVEDLQQMLHDKYGSEKANCLYKAEGFQILAKHIDTDTKMDIIKEACIRVLCGHQGRKEIDVKMKFD